MTSKTEAALTKLCFSSQFNVGGCISRVKTEPCARLCNRSNDLGEIVWRFVDVQVDTDCTGCVVQWAASVAASVPVLHSQMVLD